MSLNSELRSSITGKPLITFLPQNNKHSWMVRFVEGGHVRMKTFAFACAWAMSYMQSKAGLK